MFKSDQISLSPALNLLDSLQSVTEGPQASTSTCSQYQMIEMKRVTNLDWEVTSHRSQVTRSRHIWTDFRARAVSFGRKILLWASIMFAQGLTSGKIAAKFSSFFPQFFLLSLLTSGWVWECCTDGGLQKTDCGSYTPTEPCHDDQPADMERWEGERRTNTFCINSVELWSMLENVSQ